MSTHIVPIFKAHAEFIGPRTVIRLWLPEDYRDAKYRNHPTIRNDLEGLDHRVWIREQLSRLEDGRRGWKDGVCLLADDSHPLRSPGAGVLPLLKLADGGVYAIANFRGSNRGGAVWPPQVKFQHAFCWKEFAGVTGCAAELEDLRVVARKEMYEELSLISGQRVLLPEDVDDFPGVLEQLQTDHVRLARHFGIALSISSSRYPAPVLDGPPASAETTVEISLGDKLLSRFPAIANLDAQTNSLEFSFRAALDVPDEVTGIASFSGPEDSDPAKRLYMEDIVVVKPELLAGAAVGAPVPVYHLLGQHGPDNLLRTPQIERLYLPAPTLSPVIDAIGGVYSFRRILAKL